MSQFLAPPDADAHDACGADADTAPTLAREAPKAEPTHLLHFEPLTAGDAGLDIPCDPHGRVGLDALGEKLRNDYFFARTLIGRLFAAPTIRRDPVLAARV